MDNLPQGESCITDSFTDTDTATVPGANDLRWKRPGRGEGLGDDVHLKLFSTVAPTDLDQGSLGDCWLISAIAVVAEYPDAIQSIIQPASLALDGQYTVTLYSHESKAPKEIVIDDRLPTTTEDSCAMVQMSHDGEIWPCILEKAFAVLAGSYQNLDGGCPAFAFSSMTGCFDLAVFDLKDGTWEEMQAEFKSDKSPGAFSYSMPTMKYSGAELLSVLADFNDQKYLMGAGTRDGSDKDIDAEGIVFGHAYSLLDVKKGLQTTTGSVDLLQLRNPWGNDKEWKGDWSDNSSLWEENPDLKAECGWVKQDDGIFWMTWEDFQQEYTNIYVCKKNMGLSNTKQGNKGASGDSLHMKKKRAQ